MAVAQLWIAGSIEFMENIIVLAAVVVIAVIVLIPMLIIPRFRTERRAKGLLARYPGAEQTSVYLELHRAFGREKRREIDARIAEMQSRGWTFLRGSEASPLRTLRSWGGGLNLHFIRADGKENHAA